MTTIHWLFYPPLCRTGSFEAAATSLNVTQSAVSQRIKQLEEKVGSILVQRGRPCVATDDGLLLCQHVEQVTLLQHELSDLLAARGAGTGSAAVSIRIAVNSDSLATWFPEVIQRALDELNLLLEIIPDDQEFTEERLRSGDALAIVTSNNKPIPGCMTVPLGRDGIHGGGFEQILLKSILPDGSSQSGPSARPLRSSSTEKIPCPSNG